MTRGLGHLQVRILAAIDELDGKASVMELARHIHGRDDIGVRGSEYESCRRAVKALCRRGLLRHCGYLGIEYEDGGEGWQKLFRRTGLSV